MSFPIAFSARARMSARVSFVLTTIAAMSCNAVSSLFSREFIPLLRVCFFQLVCVVFILLVWLVGLVWGSRMTGISARVSRRF